MLRRRASAATSIALALLSLAAHTRRAAAQVADSALTVAPCSVPGIDGPARCGTLRVWEDREARRGRRIGIRFVVLPSTAPGPAREAVAYLAGGPGESAVDEAPAIAGELADVRDGRDLLFMDARGAGGSNPLPCEISRPGDPQSYLVEFFTVEGVTRCARELASRADVTRYTSAQHADDLDELRAALGYERLDLFGGSYGTRTALVYLRRHPQRVRAVLMHGTVPTDMRYPLALAPDAQAGVDGVIADCARDAACHAAFPDPAADLREALRRLDAGPAPATVVDPQQGEVATVRLSRERFVEVLRYMTYSPSGAALVPTVLHHAARGDFAAAAEQALFFRMGLVGQASRGLYLAVTCSEDVDFVDPAEAARLARGTFFGDWRVADQKAACAAWPHRALDRSFVEPVRSDVPVLVLNGEYDPATARYHAERMLRTLPNGRLVVIPHAGHGNNGLIGAEPCFRDLVGRFVRTANAKALDASCMAAVRRAPFPTDLPAGHVEAMDSAALARFARRNAAAGQPPVEIRVAGGRLRAVIYGRERLLIPIAPLRFRPLDAPQRIVIFRESGGVVTGFDTADGGAPPDSYVREASPSGAR